MFEIQAKEFVGALRALKALEVLFEEREESSNEIIEETSRGKLLHLLGNLENACSALGASITSDFVSEFKAKLEKGSAKWCDLVSSSKLFYSVLEKELVRAKLYALSPYKVSYFDDAQNLFETEVGFSFFSARDDIDEAGKCFALGRFTACVFHLMRVLEHPIVALAKVLLPDDPSPNWETVFKKIDAELLRKPNDRAIKGDVQFYAEVVAEMRAVKHAWRNRVMHIDAIVTEERAKAIFDATICFMNVVSKRLSEAGEVPPETGELEL
ncbi:MAG: hypothetical protein JSR89_00510 [Proteobacteria bacterium]|nr:hypothetical protein [Pseudomonadota bacterium]